MATMTMTKTLTAMIMQRMTLFVSPLSLKCELRAVTTQSPTNNTLSGSSNISYGVTTEKDNIHHGIFCKLFLSDNSLGVAAGVIRTTYAFGIEFVHMFLTEGRPRKK